MKVLAFHLPQFHRIPENDLWWGEGFTEWHNTKKAKPIFAGQHQPRTPLGERYYDLSDPEAIRWEMELARQYGLDGFCYYHYWFDGKLLLEKPLEIMRELPERMSYCFCWANEPWSRTWDGTHDVLVEQRYRGAEDWQAHFEYLLPFFKAETYICMDGRPVLVLYRSEDIDDCDAMITYWDECCRQQGFAGIYVIEEKNSFQQEAVCRQSRACLEFEPMYTLTHTRTFRDKVQDYTTTRLFRLKYRTQNYLYSYDRVWRNILERIRVPMEGKDTCLGAFVDWDNTARKGERSLIFQGASPEKFGEYLRRLIRLGKWMDCPMVFINAWNEWGEGTYLEPDTVNEYKYLEALRHAMKENGRD